MNKQKGLAPILIILLIAAAVGGYFIYANYLNNQTRVTQQNTKSSPSPTDETANWKTYTHNELSYSIKYPQSWALDESGTTIYLIPKELPKVTGPDQTLVFDIRKLIKEYALVSIADVGERDKSLSQAARIYGGDRLQEELKIDGLSVIKVVKKNPAKLNGDGIPNATIIRVFTKNPQGNTFIIQIESVKIEEYLGSFNEILSTFKFIP